ncbi:OmpL47-type beta-barrel domain-containing protein [Nakamurella lactea]|uniref:OmpL47-type beta-barrel domain-containing protein n=1 Tax=Nakamurella lactea TaxID=459515 RepID=UPI000408607D|nr:Ig-like domain repeat protein [Nakamurella lactea]
MIEYPPVSTTTMRWGPVRRIGMVAVALATGVLGVVAVPTSAQAAAGGTTIYVATTGDDGNSGTSADAPVADLAKAQQLVRAALPTATGAITVEVAAGTYYQSAPLEFGPADSGTAEAPVTWHAATGTTISGGRALHPTWAPQSAGSHVMVATLPAGLDFDGLFVNGKRQILARYPNFDAGAKRLGGSTSIATLNSRSANWSDPTTGFVRGMHCGDWGSVSFTITGRTADALQLHYVGDNNRAQDCNRTLPYNSNVVMAENIKEELDAPGEWFYDHTGGQLLYYPPTGTDLSTATVETAELNELVRLTGESDTAPIHDITFDGFRFADTHRTLFNSTFEGLAKGDWSVVRKGAVYLKNAANIVIAHAQFDAVGGNGVFMDGYNKGNVVSHSTFSGSGASDVQVVGSPDAVREYSGNYHTQIPVADLTAGPASENYPRDIDITDNLMQNMGRFEVQSSGVNISMSRDVTVDGNTMSGSPRACLNFEDGTWGGHVIKNNDLYDCVSGSGDNGSINAWGRSRFWASGSAGSNNVLASTGQPMDDATARQIMKLDQVEPTTIEHNRFWHDGDWAIDLDDGTSNMVLRNNLLLDGGIKLRDGFERTVENNILVSGHVYEQVSHADGGDVIEHNITLGGTAYENTQNKPAVNKYAIDANLFWNGGSPIGITPDNSHPGEKLSTDGKTLNAASSWVQAGMDVHSLIIDPKFTADDPTETYDFTVAADSPAIGLGFVNFPMTGFGATGAPLPPKAQLPYGEGSGPADPLLVQPEKLMGATATNVSSLAIQSSLGLTNNFGLYLTDVPDGSYAADAGLQSSDDILQINGHGVTADRNTFWKVYNSLAAGDDINLGVRRGQTDITVQLTKTDQPEQLNNTSGVAYTNTGAPTTGWIWRGGNTGGGGSYLEDIWATQNLGDSWRLAFNGTGLDIISQTNSDEGDVDIAVDGTFYKTVSFRTSTRVYQSTVLSISGLPAGTHTITGTMKSGGYMIVDSFRTHPAAASDTTAPTVTVTADPPTPTGAAGWYTGSVAITATAADDTDAAPKVEARIDGSDWAPLSGPVEFSDDGAHTLDVRATDAAGNVSATTSTSAKVDATAPVSNATVDATKRTVTLRAADETSGLLRIEYRAAQGAWETADGPIPAGAGEMTLEYRAIDRAGNAETANTVTVPKAGPQLLTSVIAATPSAVTTKVGKDVRIAVVVNGSDRTPTGTVRAQIGSTVLGEVTLHRGKARLVVSTVAMPPGRHSVDLVYSGDATYAGSSDSVLLTLKAA